MIEYLSNGGKFSISYQNLKEKYHELISLTDDEFKSRLPEAIHFACIVCWFKEIPSQACLSDTGIIHELSHLMHDGTTSPLYEVRSLFKEQLELV